MTPSRPAEPTSVLIPACFFLSGCAGLVLEMVWSRLLALHLGSSAESITAVVTAYMAGLGLGALAAASFAPRLRHPLRAYALLELGVAVFAVASPLLLRLPAGLYRAVYDQAVTGGGLPLLVRFVTSLVLLLPPTFAMGATLPLLVEHLTRRGHGYATRVAMLYGINTVGAVGGTLLAGFYLLPRYGNTATLQIAAIFDVTVAVLMLIGPARRTLGVLDVARPRAESPMPRPALRAATAEQRRSHGVAARTPPAFDAGAVALSAGQRRLALAVFAVSGALAMTYELGWTRRLATLIGSSVYSFALLLAVFLAGLGLGALLVGPLLRVVRRPLTALAAALGLTGAAALAGTALLQRVPAALRELLTTHHRDPTAILTGEMGLAALVLLPAALLLGAIFPLAARVAHASGESGGRAIGRVYAVNTVGTALGAGLAGMVVLPMLGSLRALEVAAWTHVAVGVLVALVAPGGLVWRAGIAIAVAAIAIAVRVVTPAPDPYQLNYGVVSMLRDIDRGSGPPPSLAQQQRRQIDALRMLSVEEGRVATVAVVSRWEQRQLVINGKVDASSGDPTEVLLGQLPMILADSAQQVLVIGYGSGITTHSVLTHPVEHVETVEIEPAVTRAGRYFADHNGWGADDPRQSIHFEDARAWLAYTNRRYDVIVSEPSNPWIAGINNLFTAEFYAMLRARLTDDGLFCQWLHGYDMTRETLASLLGTLRGAFPGAEVYRQNLDFLVVWTRDGAWLTRARLEHAFATPSVAADLARIGFTSPSDLLALYQGPIEAVAPAGGVPNTDDNGYVEFRAPLDMLRRGGSEAWNTPSLAALRLERYDPRARRVDVLATYAEGVARRRDLERMREVLPALTAAGAVDDAATLRRAIDRTVAERHERPRAMRLRIQADAAAEAGDLARSRSLLVEALTIAPDDPDLLFRAGQTALQMGDAAAGDRLLRAALAEREKQLVWRLGAGEPYQAELLLGIAASGRGEFAQAIEWFARARDRNPWLSGAHYLLAATYEVMGYGDDARREAAAGLAIDPHDEKLRALRDRLMAAK